MRFTYQLVLPHHLPLLRDKFHVSTISLWLRSDRCLPPYSFPSSSSLRSIRHEVYLLYSFRTLHLLFEYERHAGYTLDLSWNHCRLYLYCTSPTSTRFTDRFVDQVCILIILTIFAPEVILADAVILIVDVASSLCNLLLCYSFGLAPSGSSRIVSNLFRQTSTNAGSKVDTSTVTLTHSPASSPPIPIRNSPSRGRTVAFVSR